MAKTTGDTMAEGLQKVIQQVAALTSLPDADTNFLMGIQAGIAQYLRDGAQAAAGGSLQLPPGPGAPGPASASPTSGLGGPPPGMPGGMGAGPGIGGIAPPNLGAGNMDELSRLLGQGQV